MFLRYWGVLFDPPPSPPPPWCLVWVPKPLVPGGLIAANAWNKLNRIRICFKIFPVSNVAFFIFGSSLTLTSRFFLHSYFRQFSKRLSDFKRSHLCQMTGKSITSKPKFKLAHWQFENISLLKMSLLFCILRLIIWEHFLGGSLSGHITVLSFLFINYYSIHFTTYSEADCKCGTDSFSKL